MAEIRNLEYDDFKYLLIIEAESFHEGYSPYFLKMAPVIFGSTSFLALKGKSALGYILGAVEQGNPKRAWILSLAVRPKARHQGIGFRLLEECLAALSRHGVKEVKLSVPPDNLIALALYERYGFTACKTVEDYFGLGEHRLLMKKFLV